MIDQLIAFLRDFIGIFQCWAVLDPYQAGVLIRFGKWKKTLGPGFYFIWPFGIDKVASENVVVETMKTDPQALTTKDGKPIVVSLVITFKIEDVKVFLLEVEGRNTVIGDMAYGATAELVMSKTWQELADCDLGNELSKAVRRATKPYGVDIVRVKPMDFQQCRSLRLVGKPFWVEVKHG